uniref:Si:dkey-246g23.4 n=1 Tax=Neogobius melanostomus TaxID=47308 RepID=A0A8C6THJ5_9GOBI
MDLKKPGMRGAVGPPADVPDGGYGWFIVLSCFTVFVQHHFNTTATAASWVTSITVATIHVASPLASAISARFSPRSVVMIGGLLCSVGVITGSFARNLLELYLTVGFVNGKFGECFNLDTHNDHGGPVLDRRLPLANALSSAGECIFTLVFSPLSQWLIDSYSWRGAMLILGGLQLNLCVCGALLRPMETGKDLKHAKEVEAEEEQRMLQNDSPCLHQADKGAFKSQILPYLDFTLIANADFMMYSMFGLFATLGFFVPALFLVPFARTLMSISSVHLLVVTVILLGVVLLLFPLASSYVELAACSAAFGLAFGGTMAILFTVLAEVVGAHRLGSALGFFMLIRSFGGFFIDQMGDYGAGFFMAGAALIFSVFFLILLEVKSKRLSSNKRGKPKTKTASSHKAEEEAEVARR